MAEYKVKFEIFEGPLDLLLYLVKKQEVDIYEVNLTYLATEFIEYVEVMRQLDLEIAGEFLVMAATLMYIKSKELLPVDRQVTDEDDAEEEEDPRFELIRQLVEYKKFKDAAANLQSLEIQQEKVFPRMPGELDFRPDPTTLKTEISVFALINAVNAVLKRVNQKEDLREIFEDTWTVSEKIEVISRRLWEEDRLSFSSLFHAASTRHEVIVTFLALLELIRLKQVQVVQESPFGDIDLYRSRPEIETPRPEEAEPAGEGGGATVPGGEPEALPPQPS